MQNDFNIAHDTPEEIVGVEACLQMLTYRKETGNAEYKRCQEKEAQSRISFINNV